MLFRSLTPQQVADLYVETDPLSHHTGEDIDALGYSGIFNNIQGNIGQLSMDGDPWYLGGTSLELAVNFILDGYIQSDFIPDPTLTLSLGSGPNRWLNLYVQDINSENIDNLNNVSTGGYFIGDGSLLTNLPSQNLLDYWLSNGSSTATGNWNLGSFNLTTTGTETVGSNGIIIGSTSLNETQLQALLALI